MKRYRAVIKPQTAFVTPLYGDTLFGQMCWALRHQAGEQSLERLLEGYTDARPFMVVSSAFIQSHITRPALPLGMLGFDLDNPSQRKEAKGKVNVPLSAITSPISQWAQVAINNKAIEAALQGQQAGKGIVVKEQRTHNSINRMTGTTGSDGGFSPYDRQLTWYHPALKMEIYVVFDEERITASQVEAALVQVGIQGFGKEASSGLGKFLVEEFAEWAPARPDQATAWYTLAPCAPQGLSWDDSRCYYQPFVRFGRHGDMAIHTGKPFKNPVLMAQAGAVLTPGQWQEGAFFTGRGLSRVSKAIESTVHQGYSPVLEVGL